MIRASRSWSWLLALVLGIWAVLVASGLAQVPQDFALELKATASTNSPYITLNWVQRQQTNVVTQQVHRRLKGEGTWVQQASLGAGVTTWADPTAVSGVEYEYWLQRNYTGIYPSQPLAYLAVGVNVPAIENRGVLLLIVDSTMVAPLAPEIAMLTEDLIGDGWSVQTYPVSRTNTPPNVRAVIQEAYNANPTKVKAVYLLGHVPVPYSGLLGPDGHSNHYGAWPADGYYGDVDGVWSDSTVNNISASSYRNRNIPGDGKFDPSTIPSALELQVGRVDLSVMTKAPASSVTETMLLRRYLRKAHAYRHRLGPYANVPRRSIIRDGFGYFGGESFASSGWAAAFSTVGPQVDLPASGQWFTQAATNTYLMGYGCGGGNYEGAGTVGNSTDFGRRPSRVIFTMFFGSYFGDWDSDNNFLRAALAGNATGDSLGLASCWSGRPYIFLHPAGLGETIGYAVRLSMNNNTINAVHTGLMGDPALRLHIVEPPRNFAATSSNGVASLRWNASTDTDVLGYHVYRALTSDGVFSRLTTEPLAAPSYTDSSATPGLAYRYMVRTLKRETVPGGTYQNLSQGVFATLTVSAGGVPAAFTPGSLSAQVMGPNQVKLSWTDNSADETGFRIERRENNGTFASVGTVASDVTTFTDTSPRTSGCVYYYRIVALGAEGDSLPSEEASIDTSPGFYDLGVTRLKVKRSTGLAQISINRFGANFASSSVVGTTSDMSAIGGTHYTKSTNTVIFPDAESSTIIANVPITTGSTPQLPRQFNYTLSAPTSGAGIGQQNVVRVLIEDTTATLPPPWSQTLMGLVTDSSPAVFAEGAIGSAIVGGSAGTVDNGRFIYQSHTGDGVITAYIDTPQPLLNAARFGVMVRAVTNHYSPMASLQLSTSPEGSKLAYRTANGVNLSQTPSSNNTIQPPQWVRLSRSGNMFTAETSNDGGTWNALGSTTVSNIPTNAWWGLFHYADSTDNFQLVRFRHVTIADIGAVTVPLNFTATPQAPSKIALAWDPVGGATTYQIERRPQYGTFSLLQTLPAGTVVFAGDVLPGVNYEYRLRAVNGTTNSAWVSTTATAPGTVAPYHQWLQANSLPMDGSDNGAPGVSALGDGVSNALKFALSLSAQDRAYGNRLAAAAVVEDGKKYMSLTYTRTEPPPAGVTYAVKASSNLNAWSAADTMEISNSVSGGLRTITHRDKIPAGTSTPARFMRLEIVVPAP